MSEIDVERISGVSNWAYGNTQFERLKTVANSAWNNANAANLLANSHGTGRQSMWIPASAFYGSASETTNNNPTANIIYESSLSALGGDTSTFTLEFDDAIDQYATAWIGMPAGWDGANLNFEVISSPSANAVAGANAVSWLVSPALAGDTINVQSIGTTYNSLTTFDWAPWSGDINKLDTVGGGALNKNVVVNASGSTWKRAANTIMRLNVVRYNTSVSDTLPVPVHLHGIIMYYNVDNRQQ